MQVTLRIALIVYALFLFIIITHLLKKGRITEKHSIVWYIFTMVVILVGIVPKFLELFSDFLGFEVLSNFVIGILIALLTIMSLILNVMIAGQRKKTTLLIQEVSLLKEEIEKLKNNK